MSARKPSPPPVNGRDKSRIDDVNASTAFKEDVRSGLWSWTKLDDTTAVGPRIGPVLHSVAIPSSDSDDSIVTPERQHELEKGNAIQYRTCSWQKVWSIPITNCHMESQETNHQAKDCRPALFRVHLPGHHELPVVIQCLGSGSWVGNDPPKLGPRCEETWPLTIQQINIDCSCLFGRALYVSITTGFCPIWLHILTHT